MVQDRRVTIRQIVGNTGLPYLLEKTTMTQAGFELVEQPPHSPDLTPSDYRPFSKLKKHMREKRLNSLFSNN